MQFVKDPAGWDEAFYSVTGVVGEHMTHLVTDVYLLSVKQVGKKTWALARSITYKVTRDAKGLYGLIGSDNDIAYIHHEGSKGHIIVPRTKSTLRFSQNGKIVYRKMVHHPGTKPNRYLTDPLTKVIK